MRRSALFALLFACAPAVAFGQGNAGGVWPVDEAEAAGYPYNVQYGGWPPGGYEARVGRPYYWSVPGGTVPLSTYATYGNAGAPGYAGPASGRSGCGCNGGPAAYGAGGDAGSRFAGYAPGSGAYEVPGPAPALGPVPAGGPAGDPYTYHFGPGFYRANEFGHYRFPYYSYRRPWYDVGHPVRVRDTNLPW